MEQQRRNKYRRVQAQNITVYPVQINAVSHHNDGRPRIVLYFINYNDSFYIPFIKQHYSFCEKIVMYDNYSTDHSVRIAQSLGMEVRMFGRKGQLNDQDYLTVKNHCWKEQRNKGIHYVAVTDADEFICIDNLKGTAPVVTGYRMVSDKFPQTDIKEINIGAYNIMDCKQAIFSPDAINEINYAHGCHRNDMTGHITKEGSCRLLHYRYIGGVGRMIQRHAEYRHRMSQFNLTHKLGHHYLDTDNQKKEEWDNMVRNSKALW